MTTNDDARLNEAQENTAKARKGRTTKAPSGKPDPAKGPTDETCPVLLLAAEAYQLIIPLVHEMEPWEREIRGLEKWAPSKACQRLWNDEFDDEAKAKLHQHLYDKLDAILTYASYRQAYSSEGVFFQLIAAARKARQMVLQITMKTLPYAEQEELRRADRQVRNLMHAAFDLLQETDFNDALALIRNFLFPREDEPERLFETYRKSWKKAD